MEPDQIVIRQQIRVENRNQIGQNQVRVGDTGLPVVVATPRVEVGIVVVDGLVPHSGKLGVAFNTTLLALLQSAVLVFALHVIQSREEIALNRAGQYCLDNLINRLYEK